MTISRARATRRLSEAGYTATTIRQALASAGGGNRLRIANIGADLGAGRAQLGRVVRGETPGRGPKT